MGECQVRPTEDGRGSGAFAVRLVPAGTYLGDYEGEMLDETAYWARYPSGVVQSSLAQTLHGVCNIKVLILLYIEWQICSAVD